MPERFWRHVNQQGPVSEYRPDLGPCWLWDGKPNEKGYGTFRTEIGMRPAHCVAYILVIGPIPIDRVLDHLCRVPACVNPYHLEPITSVENTMRGKGIAVINGSKLYCPNGHQYTTTNTSKLTNGWRRCKICAAEQSRRAYRKKREQPT
jgi:hypothetical protein